MTVTLWNYDYRYKWLNYTYNTANFVINKQWNHNFNSYFGINNLFNKEIDVLTINGLLGVLAWNIASKNIA